MPYTSEEEDFILSLARTREAGLRWIPSEDLRVDLGMNQLQFDRICAKLRANDPLLFIYNEREGCIPPSIQPLETLLPIADEIRAGRAATKANAADRVAGLERRARRHKYLAPLIVAYRVVWPVVALIGGICGIVALLLRGC